MSAPPRVSLRDTDLTAFEFVGDPQLSPDGRQVVYTRTVIDGKDNSYRSQVYSVPADGSAPPRPLTGGPKRDGEARFSPDGRYLAFVSDREADAPRSGCAQSGQAAESAADSAGGKLGSQIYILPLAGGEARRVTDIPGEITELRWSPDSRRLAFTTRIKPGGAEFCSDPAPEESPEGETALYRKYTKDVRHLTRPQYRLDGFGWYEDRRAHVFVLDVGAALDAAPTALPPPLQITGGPYDHHGPAWSPDGTCIAVSACRDKDPDLARFVDVWLFPADGTAAGGPGFSAPRGGIPGGGPADPAPQGPDRQAAATEPVCVTKGNGEFGGAAFSPDGRTLAFVGHDKPLSWYSDHRVWLCALGDPGAGGTLPSPGPARCLTADHPRSFGDESITDMRMDSGEPRPVWSPDGTSLYMLSSDRGTTHLYRVAASSGEVVRLTSGDFVLFNASVQPAAGRAAFVMAKPDSPNDVYVAELPQGLPAGPGFKGIPALEDPTVPGGIDLRALTHTNAELLASRRLSLPERLTARAPGGPEVQGWAFPPLDAEPGRTYPTVLEIHGGPMAMYTGTFFMEFQLLCAAGIGVVITNPRGSQGYGQEYCAGIRGDWGNPDFADVMAGLDAAIARFPWIDAERLGVAGGSYGGYMTSWIIGHTQRFQAACVMRPVTNCASFFGSSDSGLHWDEVWGRDMPPWENPEDYRRQSPIAYAGNMRTPTLIIHSEQDFRCQVEQAEQLYTALKAQGVEAEFLRYPGESHGLSRDGKPWHRVHRLRQIVAWFTEHLASESV